MQGGRGRGQIRKWDVNGVKYKVSAGGVNNDRRRVGVVVMQLYEIRTVLPKPLLYLYLHLPTDAPVILSYKLNTSFAAVSK